ncbi:Uu.00g107360.m01.CDS01 [Anthostomella pinea]|uniref:Uu.00g107360.m01.CDS01 n=1 Tax=Anthostomella pinea TaxID=933095 RepID=A0AAI8YFZ1_9PEZI|nr:Uu.00g107360.m01.CDS01 [Anthostomella pinea]
MDSRSPTTTLRPPILLCTRAMLIAKYILLRGLDINIPCDEELIPDSNVGKDDPGRRSPLAKQARKRVSSHIHVLKSYLATLVTGHFILPVNQAVPTNQDVNDLNYNKLLTAIADGILPNELPNYDYFSMLLGADEDKPSSSIEEISRKWALSFPELSGRLMSALNDTGRPGYAFGLHIPKRLRAPRRDRTRHLSALPSAPQLEICDVHRKAKELQIPGSEIGFWDHSELVEAFASGDAAGYGNEPYDFTIGGQHQIGQREKEHGCPVHKPPGASPGAYPPMPLVDKASSVMELLSKVAMYQELRGLNFQADTLLGMTNLNKHIANIGSFGTEHPDTSETGHCTPSIVFSRIGHTARPELSIDEASGTTIYSLAEFEDWIEQSLERWVVIHVGLEDTCHRLAGLVEAYHAQAKTTYHENPVNLSHYDIGFPPRLLDVLLLPIKSPMERLSRIESYIYSRQNSARFKGTSVFGGFGLAYSFAVWYFDISETHQSIRSQIQDAARKDRDRTLDDLDRCWAAYLELKRRHETSTHHKIEVYRRGEFVLEFLIHEWPLPAVESEAKAVVFELQVPGPIATWRRLTLNLLVDMLDVEQRPTYSGRSPYTPSSYTELSRHIPHAQICRLGLGSEVKPFTVAHYRSVNVSEATADNICKPHGCNWDYYDLDHNCRPTEIIGTSAVPLNCSFAQSSGFPLPAWIRGYQHRSNEVLAQQCRCPDNLTLDEFKAFGHLRSGLCLQWRNILTQMVMPCLDFSRDEVAILILQAACEAGPQDDYPGRILRDAHVFVEHKDYSLSLLAGLRQALERVRENWECGRAMFMFVSLCARILSLLPTRRIQQECLAFLTQVRSVSCRWIAVLLEKRAKTVEESYRKDLSA